MRIAIITNSRIPSLTANSIQAMKVCQALVQLGHEIRLHAPREADFVSWDQLASHYGLSVPFEIEWLPSLPILKRYDFTVSSILATRRFRADLVYTWLLNPAVVALWLGWPVILEMHAEVSGQIGPWMMRKFWRSSTFKRMLVTTHPLRDIIETVADLKFPEDAVQIAPNGIDPSQYASLPNPTEARRSLDLEEKLTVGFTGHIYSGRGADLLFELAGRMPDVNFLWVGGASDEVIFWRNLFSLYLSGFAVIYQTLLTHVFHGLAKYTRLHPFVPGWPISTFFVHQPAIR